MLIFWYTFVLVQQYYYSVLIEYVYLYQKYSFKML